eukprot:CAMPEP_0169445868 /NCGR_PEP_ID=MMETSP1042-20121227/10671_1 /TAXON_ID=464988 /ORGANISM="Hemiselmis andersenii, Strain CCMP1180" /LENGTH=83 /DNA_ID=CAMNT_0009557297 /DNA_START=9 /DNA_END=256 /DNA_ORIENTATION=+
MPLSLPIPPFRFLTSAHPAAATALVSILFLSCVPNFLMSKVTMSTWSGNMSSKALYRSLTETLEFQRYSSRSSTNSSTAESVS